MVDPLVTVVVPSFQQGRYLDDALASIFTQSVPVECYVMDGGSTDETLQVLNKWAPRLAGWRSGSDDGQSAAINEGIAQGTAPYVAWLNSDDLYLPHGLRYLVSALENNPQIPAAYGKAYDLSETGQRLPVWVQPFSQRALALRCIISQPATLIRRSVWQAVKGVDESLCMAMDYDLWWKIFTKYGPLGYVQEFCAINRVHGMTKTRLYRRQHYREAINVVRRYNGRVPLKWWLAQPYSVWWKSIIT